jgi:hypothetical protein
MSGKNDCGELREGGLRTICWMSGGRYCNTWLMSALERGERRVGLARTASRVMTFSS